MDTPKLTPNNLASGRTLTRNTIWNLFGQGIPLLVAIFAIPLLIKGLGTARFGVLTLVWAVVGYFSLFDLGMGRALTKLVAEKLGARKIEDIPKLIWTALVLIGMFGIIGALVVIGISSWFVYGVLNIPIALQSEALKVFYLLALSIPIVISSTGLRGVLEAYQRFDLANIVNIPLGIFTFIGPLIVLPFSNNLFPVLAVLVVGRFLAWGGTLWLCLRVIPTLRHNIRLQHTMIRPLISFGSWMTVTNIVGPLMVYIDRFIIGALISVTAVAYYVTPYEVVTKLRIVPQALIRVLFPAFSTTLVQDRGRTAMLFGRGVNYIFIALFPLALITVLFTHEGIAFWLGEEFADNSSFVLKWLVVGVFINGLAQVPFVFIQGAGHPDLTAKTHLIELPFYMLTLWWLLGAYGIKGAAIAWVLRVLLDAVVFFTMTYRLLSETVPVIRRSSIIFTFSLCVLIAAGCVGGLLMKVLFLIVTLLTFTLVAWFLLIAPEERDLLKDFFRLHIIKI